MYNATDIPTAQNKTALTLVHNLDLLLVEPQRLDAACLPAEHLLAGPHHLGRLHQVQGALTQTQTADVALLFLREAEGVLALSTAQDCVHRLQREEIDHALFDGVDHVIDHGHENGGVLLWVVWLL